MTALSADFSRPRFADDMQPTQRKPIGVAAATTIYAGSMVALNHSGYLVPASADPLLHVVGVAEVKKDNSAGSAGDLTLVPARGCYPFTNSSSTAAVTNADQGRVCYAVDDNTVSRTNPIGEYPIAGVVAGLDADGKVLVEVGHSRETLAGVANDFLIVAGADLSSTGQRRFVSLNSSGAIVLASTAGMAALGVLLNAPASGAIGIVRRRGPVRMLCSDTTAEGVLIAVEGTNGRAKTANDIAANTGTGVITGSVVMGVALEESSGTGDVILVDLHPMGGIPGSKS